MSDFIIIKDLLPGFRLKSTMPTPPTFFLVNIVMEKKIRQNRKENQKKKKNAREKPKISNGKSPPR